MIFEKKEKYLDKYMLHMACSNGWTRKHEEPPLDYLLRCAYAQGRQDAGSPIFPEVEYQKLGFLTKH